MPKPRSDSGEKNLIAENLIRIRKEQGISQRQLAYDLQLLGCDMDRNVITRIENQKRYVSDFEMVKLCEILKISIDQLLFPVSTNYSADENNKK